MNAYRMLGQFVAFLGYVFSLLRAKRLELWFFWLEVFYFYRVLEGVWLFVDFFLERGDFRWEGHAHCTFKVIHLVLAVFHCIHKSWWHIILINFLTRHILEVILFFSLFRLYFNNFLIIFLFVSSRETCWSHIYIFNHFLLLSTLRSSHTSPSLDLLTNWFLTHKLFCLCSWQMMLACCSWLSFRKFKLFVGDLCG